MGKRSNFPRVRHDAYDTPRAVVLPLLPHLRQQTRFIEPCAGAGALVQRLETAGMACVMAIDSDPRDDSVDQIDLFTLTLDDIDGLNADVFITNPPWERATLHAMIQHLRTLWLPAWLLIDANWMFTAQAAPYLSHCSRIVTVGRVVWIPGTTMTGKDDCAWFCFQPEPVAETVFHGKMTFREVTP